MAGRSFDHPAALCEQLAAGTRCRARLEFRISAESDLSSSMIFASLRRVRSIASFLRTQVKTHIARNRSRPGLANFGHSVALSSGSSAVTAFVRTDARLISYRLLNAERGAVLIGDQAIRFRHEVCRLPINIWDLGEEWQRFTEPALCLRALADSAGSCRCEGDRDQLARVRDENLERIDKLIAAQERIQSRILRALFYREYLRYQLRSRSKRKGCIASNTYAKSTEFCPIAFSIFVSSR